MAQDDKAQSNPQHTEELSKARLLYNLLVDQIVTGQVTIEDELEKDEPDPYYLMGQTELSTALSQAATALEVSGLIAHEDLLCWGCGGPRAECQPNVDPGPVTPKATPKKTTTDKLN
jgi:hypothetical protein